MKKFDKTKFLFNLKAHLDRQEMQILSPLATRNVQGIRRVPDERHDSSYRQPFSVDVDRILHSLA